jgi:uncharacterized protein with PIN domain
VTDIPRFIVDQNVGKLARWLRMLGFDTLFFDGQDDEEMVRLALDEDRIILTRDTRIMLRKLVTSGRLKALLFVTDWPEEQICQVIKSLGLKDNFHPFTLCIEDNHPLEELSKEDVRDIVPRYVFQMQQQFMECPHCKRIYWRGTHWQAMTTRLEKLAGC